MQSANDTLYCRYGAYALKANYQLNLFLGQVTVLGLLALGLTIAAVLPKPDIVVVPIKSIPEAYRHIPIPSIKVEPQLPGSGPRPHVSQGVIPVPVADSSLDEVTIPTQDDLRGQIGFDTLVNTLGDGIFDSVPEAIPGPDSLIIVEIQAELISECRPAYPEPARRLGLEGTVWIKALVDANGDVDSAFVARSSGLDVLDQAAARAALLCKYKPAVQNGYPTRVWVTYAVKFTLDMH